MNDVDWIFVANLFADALEQPLEARSGWLDARCPGQPAVRAAVDQLLAAEASADPGFMRGLDGESVAAMACVVGTPPDTVGVFRIAAEIGRGGMGEVFLAERADGQFEQRVAVKLLKRGMDSDAILARFLRERQILAGLNHPNIARLLDGGVADDGRPYFVMEYVQGLPITRYCDEHRLSISDRLDLFCTVCRAVDYAHRNLVLHRDLKPSNILVTCDGQPKLLDFGIARLLSSAEGGDESMLTRFGPRMLTPEYAAPEQFRGGAMMTATDVYSLGAVLFELLSGRRPFHLRRDRETCTERDLEYEPPSIVAAVAASREGDTDGAVHAAATAKARSTDLARLRRQLAGDLEIIVATALRPAVERRYPSIDAIRQDIMRHQQQQPVLARRDTASYRMSRFVRRHVAGVLSASAIALLVLAFGATAIMQANRIRTQAVRLEAERDRARSAADAATRRLIARGGYRASDAQRPPDGLQSADTLLSLALAVARDIDAGSVATADALVKLAAVVRASGAQERADSLLRSAIEIFRERLGDHHRAVANTRTMLGSALLRRGRPREAIPLFELAMESYGRDPGPPVGLLLSRYRLAVALRGVGRLTESAAMFRTALGDFEARFPPHYTLTANLRHEYGKALFELGRATEAEPMVRQAIPVLSSRWGETDFRVDDVRITLVRVLTALERYAEADAVLGSALQRLEQARGPNDPVTRRARDANVALRQLRSRG